MSASTTNPSAAPAADSATSRAPSGSGAHRTGLALLAVCALAAVVYLNSLGNGFALDDTFIIENNPQVQGIERLGEALTGPYWPREPATLGLYRPLTLGTFAVDWELWDGRPFGFHLVNVLLHVLITAQVFLLLLVLGTGRNAAIAGAAVFAVHPVHVEAVANVVGRAELLASAFFLAACLLYARMRPGWPKAGVVGLLYLLSLLSKEIGVTLPGALVLVDLARSTDVRAGLRAALKEWRVYAVIGTGLVGYFVLRWVNIGTVLGGDAPWFWGEPGSTRVWTALRVVPEYLRLMVLPIELVPDYSPAVIVPERSLWSPLVLFGVATAVVAAVAAVRAWGSARLVSLGILWFAGTVLPVSGLLFATGVLLAERTLYLPSIGLSLVVAGIANVLARRRPDLLRPAALVLLLLLAAAGVRTWVQNPVWRDTGAVMAHLMEGHPNSYRAMWVQAARLDEAGRSREAVGLLAGAVRMVPGHYTLRMDYGTELYQLGRYDAAAAQFDTARQILPTVSQPHIPYVVSLIMAERHAEAAAAAEAMARRSPHSALPHHLHAQALARGGRLEEAKGPRRRAAEVDQTDTRWAHWANLAALELATGDTDAAIAALVHAREHAPPDAAVPTLPQLAAWLEEGSVAAVPLW